MSNLGFVIMHEYSDGKEVAYPVDRIDWIKREGNMTHVHVNLGGTDNQRSKQFTVWVRETPSELVAQIGIRCSVALTQYSLPIYGDGKGTSLEKVIPNRY